MSKLKVGGDLKTKYAGHLHRFTHRQIKDLLNAAGFEIFKIPYSYHLFGQILDLIQWLAAAVRATVLEPGGVDLNDLEPKTRYNVVKVLASGGYHFCTRSLEVISLYESTFFKGIPRSMAVYVLARKQ